MFPHPPGQVSSSSAVVPRPVLAGRGSSEGEMLSQYPNLNSESQSRVMRSALADALSSVISSVAATIGDTPYTSQTSGDKNSTVTNHQNMSYGDGSILVMTSDSNAENNDSSPNQSDSDGNFTAPFTTPEYLLVSVAALSFSLTIFFHFFYCQ